MHSGDGYDHLLKLLLVGDAGVGKSSILLRFTDDTFDDHLQSTIGVDFKVKMMRKSSKDVKITIWDTAGQERFRTLTSSYYRGAHGIMLVYDVTRRDTFKNLKVWLNEIDQYCGASGGGGGKEIVKLLVANKIDKDGDREVSWSEGAAWARGRGMLFIEASAKTDVGISQVFNEVVQKVRRLPCVRVRGPFLRSSTTPFARLHFLSSTHTHTLFFYVVLRAQILENPVLLSSTVPGESTATKVEDPANNDEDDGFCC